MKKLVLIIILSVSGMTFAQDLMWGFTVDAARKKQDDVSGDYYIRDFNNSIFLGIGAHINYRIYRKLYLQSGVIVYNNKHTDYTFSNNWGYQSDTKITQKSIDIPLQLSLKIWKGFSVCSGISLSKLFSKYNFENNDGTMYNEKVSDFMINKTPFGLQYAFSNGLTIGVNKQVLRLGHSYENSIETDFQMNYYTLRLSYDIGQYEWQ
jgi:hypothetical protein